MFVCFKPRIVLAQRKSRNKTGTETEGRSNQGMTPYSWGYIMSADTKPNTVAVVRRNLVCQFLGRFGQQLSNADVEPNIRLS